MMKKRIALLSFRSVLAVMYPTSVMAAQDVLNVSLPEYTSSTYGMMAFLMSMGAMTGLLQRLKKEYVDFGEVKHPKLFIFSNIFGAFTAGILGVIIGEYMQFGGALRAAIIILTAYAGTLFLEKMFDWFMFKYFPSTEVTPLKRDNDFSKEKEGP